MKSKLWLGSAAILVSVLTPGAAWAADEDQPADSDGSEGLGEIVVTAQRRGENLQKVPIAVSAFTSERLEAVGVRDSRDLVAVTPSLQLPTQAGFMLPRIRGVGSSAVGSGIESPVATYVDGIYIGNGPSSLLSLGGVERIEVLKGPQGTLFGRNSTGGLINVITKDPAPGFNADFSAGYGNYDTITAKAYAAGGSETFSIGAALQYSGMGDGYGTNFFDNSDFNRIFDDFAARTTLLFRPTDNLKIRIAGDYSYLDTSFPSARQLASQPLAADPTFALEGPYDSNQNVPHRRKTEQRGVAGNITLDLGGVSLVSITGYRKSEFTQLLDSDRTPVARARLNNFSHDDQFSQELQLASGADSAFKWVIGGYYYDGRGFTDPGMVTNIVTIPPAGLFNVPIKVLINGFQKTRSYALYGQGTYPVTDKLNITGGIRYTDETRTAASTKQTFNDVTGVLFTAGPLAPVVLPKSKTSYHPITWRGAIDYLVTPDVMLFGSVSKGFKSGGFNVSTPEIKTPFLPETLIAYEAGVKSKLFNRNLRFNASGFYYDYKNILVLFSPGPGIVGTVTGPTAKIYGLDVDLEAALTDKLRLIGGMTLMHARFGNFPGATFALPQTAGTNCITTFQVTSANACTPLLDASGNRTLLNAKGNILPYTSEFIGNIGFNYSTDAFDGKLDFNGNLYYNDGFYPEADNLRRQPSYATLDASVNWTSASGFSVRVWGKNLTNKAVLTQILSNNTGSTAAYYAPRTYGITLGKKF